jgi:hypothetical protein
MFVFGSFLDCLLVLPVGVGLVLPTELHADCVMMGSELKVLSDIAT